MALHAMLVFSSLTQALRKYGQHAVAIVCESHVSWWSTDAVPRGPNSLLCTPSLRRLLPDTLVAVGLCGTQPDTLDTRLFMGTGCPRSWTPFGALAGNDDSNTCAGGSPLSFFSRIIRASDPPTNVLYFFANLPNGTAGTLTLDVTITPATPSSTSTPSTTPSSSTTPSWTPSSTMTATMTGTTTATPSSTSTSTGTPTPSPSATSVSAAGAARAVLKPHQEPTLLAAVPFFIALTAPRFFRRNHSVP